MAENIVLNNVTTFTNDTTAVNTINGNNTTIVNAFTDVLSRSGVSPNTMGSNLDMNNNQIINLPPPSTINSPARLADVVSNPSFTIPATGTSGHVVPFLDGNNTWSGTNAFSPGIARSSLAQGSALSVIGNTTNATANVADIVGTTRQVMSINTAGTVLGFAQPQGDQLLGTITNDNASAGNVGEYITSLIGLGSAVGLSIGSPVSITSIILTAGDWEIWASPCFIPAGTTSITLMTGSVSPTNNTMNNIPGFSVTQWTPAFVPGNFATFLNTARNRVSLTTNTTYYLVVQSNFTVSTMGGFGQISARRIR